MPERKRNSNSSYRTRSSSTPPSKRSLGFSTPPSSAVSPPNLSPEHIDASTDRVLTFLQSARDRNVPVRFGKWSREEDAYLTKLISLFQDGLLAEMESTTSLRSFLSLMLNCCPMRISKKQMHGHAFMGKTKYVRHSNKMTQQQYDELCHEVWTLRDEFLKAWAKEEYARRSTSIASNDSSFQDWYDKVVAHVPTPKLAKRSSLKECKRKRRIESLDELKMEMKNAKRQEREMMITIRPLVVDKQQQEQVQEMENAQVTEMLDPEDILPLEPAAISEPALVTSPDSLHTGVMALPTAYCSDTVSMGDWLATSDRGCAVAQWNDFESAGQLGEARYTFREDQVQVSVHLDSQQTSMAELSMTRRSSSLVIDFGAPSCWYTGEEPKCTSFLDYLQWTDNDLADELAMVTDPGIFSWDDSSPVAQMRHSPTLNFL